MNKPRLTKNLETIGLKGPEDNDREACLDAQKEQQVVTGEKFDGNAEEIREWFRAEVEKVMKIK